MNQFSPPGNVNDLPAAGKQKWSDIVQQYFDLVKSRTAFFSPLILTAAQVLTPKLIPWNAFPKKYLTIPSPDPTKRFKTTEQLVTQDLHGSDYSGSYSTNGTAGGFEANGIKTFRFRDQDEYLEWKTFRNADGSLKKIVFTCDHPEYWKFIGDYDIDLLVSLYQNIVDPAVQKQDLLFQTQVYELDGLTGKIIDRKGKYNPFNKWNTTDGIMHLSHPANYLSAEIQLAADASVIRKDALGHIITDTDTLCQKSHGDPERFSDPTIVSLINSLVRNKFSVSIADPVALYIHDINEANFTFPAGYTLKDFWTVTRGDQASKHILRAEFAAPAGVKLEDIKISANGYTGNLQYGGQIADCINMGIYGLGFQFPAAPAASLSAMLLETVLPEDQPIGHLKRRK